MVFRVWEMVAIVMDGIQGVGNGCHGYGGCSCISYPLLAYIELVQSVFKITASTHH